MVIIRETTFISLDLVHLYKYIFHLKPYFQLLKKREEKKLMYFALTLNVKYYDKRILRQNIANKQFNIRIKCTSQKEAIKMESEYEL